MVAVAETFGFGEPVNDQADEATNAPVGDASLTVARGDLDEELRVWADSDKDAQASAIFSRGGILSSPRAQNLMLLIGAGMFLLGVGGCWSYGGGEWTVLGTIGFGLWGICAGALAKLKHPVRAMQMFKYGAVPWTLVMLVGIPCKCSCSAQHSDTWACGEPMVYRRQYHDYDNEHDLGCVRANTTAAGLGSNATSAWAGDWEHVSSFNARVACCNVVSLVGGAVAWVVLVIFVINEPQHAVAGMLCFGTGALSGGITSVVGGGRYSWGSNTQFTCFLVSYGIAAYLLVRRRAAVRRAHALVRDQKEVYDRIWEGVVQAQAEDLEALHQLWPEVRDAAGGTRARKAPLTQRKASLNQLYAQADAVNPWFQDLVRSWAGQVSDNAAAAWKYVPNKKPQCRSKR